MEWWKHDLKAIEGDHFIIDFIHTSKFQEKIAIIHPFVIIEMQGIYNFYI